MFRPPEYAALINPAHNAFANAFAFYVDGNLVFNRKKGLSPELFAAFHGLGPKEWSPIGEYKLKDTP